ncbi:MAG: hypothetical protein DMG21_10465 [Acidobacteria bacterium]|nr:MAG: hypothetical protein DMG21_10465 [Acidobacteriota bacterium]
MCTGAIASRETVKQSGRFGAKGGSTMPSASTAATPKGTAAGQSPEKLRLLDSRRLSELLGFLLCVLGLLLFLSLASYLAFDPSLNTSAHFANHIHNWIGPAGSYTAYVLFQAFGWAAYLIPGTLMVVGVAKLRDRQPGAPLAKSIGALTLIASASAILELFPLTPMVGETVRGGGLAGYLIALGLVGALNAAGAWIVAVALFLTSLFLLTRFSFSSAAEFSKACWDSTQSWRARWSEWSETRRQERARRKVELHRLIGKAPIVSRRCNQIRPAQADSFRDSSRYLARQAGRSACSKSSRAGGVSRSDRTFETAGAEDRGPGRSCLQASERHHPAPSGRPAKRQRRRLEGACRPVDQEVQRVRRDGDGDADPSRPRGDHLRIQARSRNQVQPRYQSRGRPLPGAARRIHFHRAHPGQVHGGD